MTSIAQVAKALRTVVTRVANRAARTTRCVRRRAKLSGANFGQTLVFGWLAHPEATYEELAQTAATVGGKVTAQGVEQRFSEAAAQCLERVVQAALHQGMAAAPVAIPLRQRFSAVSIDDSTQVQLPAVLAAVGAGSGGGARAEDQTAALKLQVRLDCKSGQLSGPFLQAGRASDRPAPTQPAPLPAGSLRLADLGYFALDVLPTIAAHDAYGLTRVRAGTQVSAAHGHALDVARTLASYGPAVVELAVGWGGLQRLPTRLSAVRVPAAVATQRRRAVRADARRRGQTVSQARLRLADWTLFCTTVPPALLRAEEVLVVARVRWQIELLCKVWKSAGHLAPSRSEKPWRVVCEVSAQLLGLSVQQWVLVTRLWAYPDRSAGKAAQTRRKHALPLAAACVAGVAALRAALKVVQRTLAAGCRLNKRKKNPRTFQLLLAVTEEKLA